MLDSISRPHFNRIMPRPVEALRKIVQEPNIKATALDFELVQSIGQQTFENLRPFFSGVLKDDNNLSASGKNTKAPLGVEVLYGTFKKWGYQTLFQEDLCWYDLWGSALTDLVKRRAKWEELQAKVAKKQIDHYGLTHFSCTMVNKYGRTNHYDEPAKMCLNGQFFNWYFMDYITKVYTALQSDEKAKPLLSYMHFNTAHEMTGTRIVNLDANLAKFFVDMEGFPNTLTMIFSDHGHKMTPFSHTEQGRRELFDLAFFMIVSDGVKEKLGPQRMAALETNQKRLFILQDVHKALVSLHDPEKMNSQDISQTGIFSVIPANRTCADLYMLPLTRCKCEGFDEEGPIQDKAENHKWLAEFAVGFMNDVTQKQYMKEDRTGYIMKGLEKDAMIDQTEVGMVQAPFAIMTQAQALRGDSLTKKLRNYSVKYVKISDAEMSESRSLVKEYIEGRVMKYCREKSTLPILRLEYTGSVYERLKTEAADEVDVMVVLQTTKSELVLEDSAVPGYARLKARSDSKFRTRDYASAEGYINPERLRNGWFYSLVVQAVNNFTAPNVNLVVRSHGPAVQLDIVRKGTNQKLLSADLVPCFQIGHDSYYVAKPYTGRKQVSSRDLLWRQSFSLKEKGILEYMDRDFGCRHELLRILKTIVKKNPTYFGSLESYHLKTAFMHYMKKEVQGWCGENALEKHFLGFLRALHSYLEKGCLPHYWLAGVNLLEDINLVVTRNMADRLKRILNSDGEMNKILA